MHYSAHLLTSYCAVYACTQVSREQKGGGGDGWGYPQGDMHMVAVVEGYIETAWLGLGKPVLALVAQMGLQTLLTTFGCKGDLGSERMFAG